MPKILSQPEPKWKGENRFEEICYLKPPEPGEIEIPPPVSFPEMIEKYPERRPVVIEGIAREGETVNVIAPAKIGKSFMVYGIALSVANGQPWLGKFETTPGEVLIIDNELHYEELCHRINQVAEEMQLCPDDVKAWCFRGMDMNYEILKKRFDWEAMKGRVKLVIVDSYYKMLPPLIDENDNNDIRHIYNLIDHMADLSRTSWWNIHHPSKGDQSGKDVIDVGAGAGAQSRACDAHLVLRPLGEDDTYALEARVRSFPPLPPIGVRWQFPMLTHDPDLDPKGLSTPQQRLRQGKDEVDKNRLLKKLTDVPQTSKELCTMIAIMNPRCKRLLGELVAEGRCEETAAVRSGNDTTGYYL